MLKYSIPPPTMMPSRFEAKAISAVSLSRKEFVKIMLARNTGAKASTLASIYLSNPILKYILASVLAFPPVFLANIIFTNSFRDSETADITFASNLLGLMVGGGLEYFSMLFGYRLLLIPVIVFYACALVLRLRSRRTPGTVYEAVASEPALASQ